MNKFVAFILVVFFTQECLAQVYQRNASIPVKREDYYLSMPWAGGINDGQFSSIDVNGDGVEDLFVFDRIGNRKLVFIQSSDVQGQSYYFHAPQYQDAFPQNLGNWVLLRDFNCDGLKDIYTNYQSGIVLYKNTTDVTGFLSFEPYNAGQLIQSSYDLGSGPFTAPLYCMSVDIPAIDDLDGDGDMDIVTNTESSSGMYFYKSMQIENGDCNNPQFICANRCFGMVTEAAESFNLFIGDQFNCVLNVAQPRETNLHTGGTILTLDMNGNGIHDILIGDVTESNMAGIFLVDTPNGPDSAVAVQYDYPLNQSINMHLFPAAYYEDVNNDGIRDLLVSPNAMFGAEDKRSVLLYLNQGQDDNPLWSYVSHDFLQSQMIDVGVGAHPVPVDIDGDGDLDIIVASRTYNVDSLQYESDFHLLSNDTTSSGDRYFQWLSNDWMTLSGLNLQSMYPAFGDWDGDGDQDLIIGDLNGLLYGVRNEGNSEQFLAGNLFQWTDVNGTVMDVGQSATPQMVDINQDGLLDLVVGEKNGNVNYFKNVGTLGSPDWSLVTDTLAGAEASSYLGLDGYSVPFVRWSDNNHWDLMLGTEKGWINHYSFQGISPQTGTLIEEQWQGIREGDRSSIAWVDITQDGTLDMLYGHSGGGMAIYTGDSIIISSDELVENTFLVYPNPGKEILQISSYNDWQECQVFNAIGGVVFKESGRKRFMQIDTQNWSQGIYLVVIKNGEQSRVERWVKW